jgi:hypothetical protein
MPLLPEAGGRLPQNGTAITAGEPGGEEPLIFSWDAVPGAGAYLFTLRREDGKEAVQAGPQAETDYVLGDLSVLGHGAFTWQVEAVYMEGGRIIRRGKEGRNWFRYEVPLAAPVLEAPGADAEVAVQEGEAAVFSWGVVEGAEYYRFKLYQGEALVYENGAVKGVRQDVMLEGYPEGAYRWTVEGYAGEVAGGRERTGRLAEGFFNTWRVYPVEMEFPDDGAEFEGLTAYFEPAEVRWSSANRVTASRFILSREPGMTGEPVAVIDNPPESIRLPRLEQGEYYWTVRAETEGGYDISAEEVRLIRVGAMPLLPEAGGRLPQNGTAITAAQLRRNRSISFSWNAVPGATGYFFTLEHEGTGRTLTLIQEGPITKTTFVLEDLTVLDKGTFIWRLEAVLTDPIRERREKDGRIIRRGEIGESWFRIEFALPDIPDMQRPGLLYGRDPF